MYYSAAIFFRFLPFFQNFIIRLKFLDLEILILMIQALWEFFRNQFPSLYRQTKPYTNQDRKVHLNWGSWNYVNTNISVSPWTFPRYFPGHLPHRAFHPRHFPHWSVMQYVGCNNCHESNFYLSSALLLSMQLLFKQLSSFYLGKNSFISPISI